LRNHLVLLRVGLVGETTMWQVVVARGWCAEVSIPLTHTEVD
jgi:hypothetical protein